jgi:DNA polymerase-3 subunit delta'
MNLDEAFDYLRRVFESSKVAQAYIVEGDLRGNAQQLTERTLPLLFCEATSKPCGRCRACHQIKQHTHPDVLWVEPQKKSRIISIDQVRELQQLIFQTAFAGGWKACVLVGADRLNQSASNAFLKTLEEPPEKSVFFLLTDSPQSLLPTIISRCQYISLSTDEIAIRDEWREELRDILAGHVANNPTLAIANAERMLRLLKKMKAVAIDEEYERAENRAVVDESGKKKVTEEDDTLDARAEAQYREWRKSVLRLMLSWHRDILLLVCGSEHELLINDDQTALLAAKAQGISQSKALANVRIIEDINRRIEENLAEGPVINFAFQRLGRNA